MVEYGKCACCDWVTAGVSVDKVNLCFTCETSRAICEANVKAKE